MKSTAANSDRGLKDLLPLLSRYNKEMKKLAKKNSTAKPTLSYSFDLSHDSDPFEVDEFIQM